MKILFLVPYPLKESPSQRFRFEQYFEILKWNHHSFDVQSFLDSHNWRIFFKPGNSATKARMLIKGFLRRFVMLFTVAGYDFIFIHREATPIGPPVFEWFIAKIFRKKLIYDFDDAIWLTDRASEPPLLRRLKWRSKVSSICRWSYKVSCGNQYLCDYAFQFNRNVVYNPTTIDTENLHTPSRLTKQANGSIVIGWTGTHSTLKYLDTIEQVLRELTNRFQKLKFVVIANERPVKEFPSLIFQNWNPDTEIDDLRAFDIGIMPLPDDEWANGKCGFKALQYMALEIPTVASPVGVNRTIIEHGVDGFLASNNQEWVHLLSELIDNASLRRSIGQKARQKVVRAYSVLSNKRTFLSLFEGCK